MAISMPLDEVQSFHDPGNDQLRHRGRLADSHQRHGAWSPHVQVIFRDGSRVSVAIETGEVWAGGARPLKRLAAALADIRANKAKYLDTYRRLNP